MDAAPNPSPNPDRPAPAERRPLLERVGLAAVALVMAAMFGAVAVASFAGGEAFLGTMAAIGCLMVLWVGAITLFRG